MAGKGAQGWGRDPWDHVEHGTMQSPGAVASFLNQSGEGVKERGLPVARAGVHWWGKVGKGEVIQGGKKGCGYPKLWRWCIRVGSVVDDM